VTGIALVTLDDVRAAVRLELDLEHRPGVRKHAYSIEDAAFALGVHRTTVSELLAAGELACREVGTRKLIPVGEIDRFLSAGASTPSPPALLPGGGVDGPAGSEGITPGSGSVSPLPGARGAAGRPGPDPTARGGPTSPAA
jgi:excisionase family DNA binding protein